MYLCYYNCILTKAQGQLIITPSISNLHKPILFKDSMFGVTGLPHRLWKYPHQTSLRPSKGIKGVVCRGLLSTPAHPPGDRQGLRTKGKRHNYPTALHREPGLTGLGLEGWWAERASGLRSGNRCPPRVGSSNPLTHQQIRLSCGLCSVSGCWGDLGEWALLGPLNPCTVN